MTLEKAKEILTGIEYEMSIISNQNKASDKAWDRVKQATEIVLKKLEDN